MEKQKYEVSVYKVVQQYWEVEADSEDEAEENYESGLLTFEKIIEEDTDII